MYQGKYVKNSPSGKSSKNQGPKLGSLIFYTVFFFCVFLFYGATYFGMLELRDWLARYELAQPDRKSQEVFQEIFLDGNWGDLYDAAGVQDTMYESKEVFVRHMEEMAKGDRLSYMETSAGLSGGKKYIVRLGEKKIAAFTLKDHNSSDDPQSLPDWQLSDVDLQIERTGTVRIEKALNHTACVNGIPLEDCHTIQISTALASDYLPAGIAGDTRCVQELTGLIAVPTVTVLDETGREVPVRYVEAADAYVEQTAVAEAGEQERELALQALKTYALYMMKEADSSDLGKYYKKASDAYRSITDTERGYVQDAASYEFRNETVTDYCRYTDNLFSMRVSVTLNQYRSNGSVKESAIDQSMFFEKQNSGKWLCYAMTSVDVTQPVVKVRVTFQKDGQILHSDFYENTISQIPCPGVTPPEGKVFAGWASLERDNNNNLVKTLVFQPDETGIARLPPGSTLAAVTVSPLFE